MTQAVFLGSIAGSVPMEAGRRAMAWLSAAPVIRHVGRGIYDSAVRHVAYRVAAIEGVASLISYNSYARRSVIPGYSDIDLSVIVRDDLDASSLVGALRRIDAVHGAARRLYPMIDGNTVVYTRKAFETAWNAGCLTQHADAWRCEWGEESVLDAALAAEAPSLPDRLAELSRTYLTSFHANLLTALQAGRRRPTIALERSTAKIYRKLSTLAPAILAPKPQRLDAFVHQVIVDLEEVLRAGWSSDAPHTWPVVSPGVAGVPRPRIRHDPETVNGNSVISLPDGSTQWHILPDAFAESHVAAALSSIVSAGRDSSALHQVVTRRLYEISNRHLNPLGYYGRINARDVQGEDLLANMPEPTDAGIRCFFRTEALKLLQLPPAVDAVVAGDAANLQSWWTRCHRLRHFIDRGEFILNARQAYGDCPDRRPEVIVGLMRDTIASLTSPHAAALVRSRSAEVHR
jgi:hypothetical protein